MARRSDFERRFPKRESDVAHTLARNVRHLRKVAKKTQEALALELKVPTPDISRIENARGNPTLLTLERLADALGVRFIDLFQPR